MKTPDIAKLLASVIDPELGIDIVSLGLVYGIGVDDSAVQVALSMTSPDCPMGDAIANMAASRLSKAIEGRQLALEIVAEPEWSIGMADADARRRLGLKPG